MEPTLASGVKRRPEEATDGSSPKEPRGADSNVGAARIANAGAAKQEAFNEAYLRFYYKHLFPYNQMFRWLSYGNDPDSPNQKVKRDYFLKREICFTMAGDVFIRYLCFRDEAAFMKAINAKQPEKIDIGPVYNHPPSEHTRLKGVKFQPEERELVFDIDLTDYDDIRTCCTGANICKRCWAYMGAAIRFLDNVLRSSFGFSNIMFVYSGRRGVHCWVCDEEARKLNDDARGGVVSYISMLASAAGGGGVDMGGGAGAGGGGAAAAGKGHSVARVMGALTVPLHPVFSAALRDLQEVFETAVIPASGQGLLASPDQWSKLLDQMPDFPVDTDGTSLKQVLAKEWAKPGNSAEQRWRQLRDSVKKLIDMGGGSLAKGYKKTAKSGPLNYRQRFDLERLIPGIVFTYTFPRLDVEVSKHRNHLLKAPFCIHPKTGRVCVPINPAQADAFDPAAVPTVAKLTEEGTTWARRMGKGAYAQQAAAAAAAGGAGSSSSSSSGISVGEPASAADDDAMSEGASTLSGGASSSSAKARGDMDGMVDSTSLRPYLRMFEGFVKQCEAETWRAIRASSEASAAFRNDW